MKKKPLPPGHGGPLDGVPWWGKAIIVPIGAVMIGCGVVGDKLKMMTHKCSFYPSDKPQELMCCVCGKRKRV